VLETLRSEIETMVAEVAPRNPRDAAKLEEDICDLVYSRTGLTIKSMITLVSEGEVSVFLLQSSFKVSIDV